MRLPGRYDLHVGAPTIAWGCVDKPYWVRKWRPDNVVYYWVLYHPFPVGPGQDRWEAAIRLGGEP